MSNDIDDDPGFKLDCGPLDTADPVARAAYIWIRSICLHETLPEDERLALAGGLIAGLCDRLSLNPKLRQLISYVYALLNEEGGQALTVSRIMLDRPASISLRKAWERGRFEAAAIVEMLAYYDQKQNGAGEAPDIEQ